MANRNDSDSGLYPTLGTRGSRWYFHWSAAIVALIVGLGCVLFTGVPLLGRVAWADETNRLIDSKVAIAVKPINQALTEVRSQVKESNDLLKEQVTASLASNICRYNVRRNKEPDIEERLRITNQINEMRKQYAKFNGYEFNIADC